MSSSKWRSQTSESAGAGAAANSPQRLADFVVPERAAFAPLEDAPHERREASLLVSEVLTGNVAATAFRVDPMALPLHQAEDASGDGAKPRPVRQLVQGAPDPAAGGVDDIDGGVDDIVGGAIPAPDVGGELYAIMLCTQATARGGSTRSGSAWQAKGGGHGSGTENTGQALAGSGGFHSVAYGKAALDGSGIVVRGKAPSVGRAASTPGLPASKCLPQPSSGRGWDVPGALPW